MAKKGRSDQIPGPNSVVNRDILQRLNFLYQASAFMQSISTASPASANVNPTPSAPESKATRPINAKPGRKRTRREGRARISTEDIAKSYVRTMQQIGQKATVKLDPTVKRTLCRGCDAILIPGVSAAVRVSPSSTHGHTVTTTCLKCRIARRIPAPPAPRGNHDGIADRSETDDALVMDVDAPPVPSATSGIQKKGRKTKGPVPRLPPLFERDVGHIVFRGNEQIQPAVEPDTQ